MTKRFFKLIYVFVLIAIVLSLPIYLLTSIQFDKVVITSYKAKCLANNEYVVLQGSAIDDVWIIPEYTYNDNTFNNTKKDLNFYCKYYTEIQPHIVASNQARTTKEQVQANQDYFTFQQGVFDSVSEYPKLYKLEVVKEELVPYRIYGPVIDSLAMAFVLFILLQIARMSYVYIVFGEIVWHPFKQNKK